MPSTEERDAAQAVRQARERRGEHKRQLRRAIAVERRLTHHRDGAHKPIEREADRRYAYLAQSHD
jgi:hypothetical protein